jgi:hypothetical protein
MCQTCAGVMRRDLTLTALVNFGWRQMAYVWNAKWSRASGAPVTAHQQNGGPLFPSTDLSS